MSKVPFLDTLVHLEDNHIHTSLYCKPTDANNYLHYTSAHARHCIKGIPYGQFLRIKRICTRDEDFLSHALVKATHFIRRGYPRDKILDDLLRAVDKPRVDLLTPKVKAKSTDTTSYLVTTFHPTFNNITKYLL